MGAMRDMISRVRDYLGQRDWSDVPIMSGRVFHVRPLAQGEYNLNYTISDSDVKLVFRINMGTQIERDDQIVYEYKALALLAASGVTPVPYFVDDSRTFFDRGVSVMSFLPGEPLDYTRDLMGAAGLLARIHQVRVRASDNHLIREDAPLSMIYDECVGLLKVYFDSELGHPGIKTYLKEVLAWAKQQRAGERYYLQDPWPCVVNTEVNANNFVVDRQRGTMGLVDWEMPRYGDPSQDLCHFCSPLTTLWKTDYRMGPGDRAAFMAEYRHRMSDRHLGDTLEDRVRLRDPFVRLRGIAWTAMGWTAYQTGFDGVRNPDTWTTLQRYMDPAFIRSLFDPVMSG